MLWKKNKQNINKRLQCKAKTHISERSYFYKKTVPVSLFSLCGLLPVPKYRNEAEKKTLKKRGFRLFLWLLLYFRAMHTKIAKMSSRVR